MDEKTFEKHVMSGERTEAVADGAMEYLHDNADFRAIRRSALRSDEVDQSKLVSVSLPRSTEGIEPEEFIDDVRNKILNSKDFQKYQLRHNSEPADTVEVRVHGHGFSAFALNE
jgi:hypothetical protein